VIKDGGAAHAGLKRGDQILKIDNSPINQFSSFKDIVYKIRGKSGTKVKLTILRNGEILTKNIKRQKITWDAVEVSQSNSKLSLIKINFFNEKTLATLESELKDMKKRGTRSLILDLRDNTGGLFEEGLKAIKLFAAKNETVLLVKYNQKEVKKCEADMDGIAKGFKIVVLIGPETKSMGEAFAASLKLLNNATIIGEKSFGKGTMETVLRLANEHSIKFTIGRLFTADNKTWDKAGITPDIEVARVKSQAAGLDNQIELAKLLVSKK